MRKITALLLSITFIFLLSSCGEKPAVDPTETTASTSAVIETTEKSLPYWDTHEVGTYAGLVNGERFSGGFDAFIPYVKCKNGDVILIKKPLTGMRENMSSPNLTEEEMIFYPDYDIYYNASLNSYSSAFEYDWKPFGEESRESCDEIIITKGSDYHYYYNDSSCVIDDSLRIEANDDFVVSVYEDSWEESGEIKKIIERYYWKKGAGLIGIYVYEDFYGSGSKEINIRFTSKTADGWKMDETIVPTALEGSERKWPEKLWPEEYKGLDDPELLAILNEY